MFMLSTMCLIVSRKKSCISSKLEIAISPNYFTLGFDENSSEEIHVLMEVMVWIVCPKESEFHTEVRILRKFTRYAISLHITCVTRLQI